MGSFLSSAAGVPGEADRAARSHLYPTVKDLTRRPTNHELAGIEGYDPVSFQQHVAGRPTWRQDEIDSAAVRKLVHCALKHYNSKNRGADFEYPSELTTRTEATSIYFRDRFWYHVCFMARRRNADDTDDELQLFFAELGFNEWTCRPNVQTCTILEKPLCRVRSRCAFCTDGSKILHPSDTEFACGKEGHEKEFFNKRDMLAQLVDL